MKVLMAGLCILIIQGSSFKLSGGYPSSAPLILNNKHNVVIDGKLISHVPQACIQLINCSNIVIKNCTLTQSGGVGVYLFRCKNITVTQCFMERVSSGVYALESTGIAIVHNQVKNVLGPFPRGQMVQFDDVNGGGNRVSFNKCENILGASNPEDVISMYKSSGTATDPIQITGNLIRGGGPSKTGGGIMLGDNGGSYIIAKDNILVNPGQYGMAISGGTHIVITNNKIYSIKRPFTNVGLYIWKQSAVGCALNTISKNEVNWTNAAGETNHNWNQGNCGPVIGWETNIWGAKLTAAILPENL
jgi:parallel beta-helix repeat protein